MWRRFHRFVIEPDALQIAEGAWREEIIVPAGFEPRDDRPLSRLGVFNDLVLRDYDTEIHDSADWFLPGSGLVLPVRDWYAACDSLHLDQDQVETLVGLAAEGRFTDFRDLAAMLGVSPDRIDALWTGTVRRVKKVS